MPESRRAVERDGGRARQATRPRDLEARRHPQSLRKAGPVMAACVFCEIVANRLPSWKVAESDRALAFLTIGPLAEGHTLVVPRAHAETIRDVPPREWAGVWELVQTVSDRIIATGLGEGVNLLVASGRAAEQEVFHFHVHVVPRRAGDGVGFNAWLEGRVRALPDARQAEIARTLASPPPT